MRKYKRDSLINMPYEEYKKRCLKALDSLTGMIEIDIDDPRVRRTGDLLWIYAQSVDTETKQ